MGRHLAWHSLYLQLLAESGLIGFGALVWFIAVLVGRSIRHFRKFKEVTPLVCLFTYLIIGASVQGIDAVSGVFLGMSLLAIDTIPRYRVSQSFRMVEEHA
jgi:O-antigen ligase